MRAWYGLVRSLRDKAFASSGHSLHDRQSHHQVTSSQTYLSCGEGLALSRGALHLPDIFDLLSKHYM